MHELEHSHTYACMCVAFRDTDAVSKLNPTTSTHCLMQPYTDLPTPISAPRCTEAESRMEQSRVRWQWHPSHAMNNQWTPSGAYNRGAQLQSFTPGWLSLALSLSSSYTLSLTFSPSLSPVPSPFAPFPLFPHILPPRSHHLVLSHHLLVFFSIYISIALFWPPLLLPMLLCGLCDRIVMVSPILIQQYNSQAANKVTCCPLKDMCFYDL